MAELELSIRYKTSPARLGVTVMGALLPLWGLIVPFCMGLFIALLLQVPGGVPPLMMALIMGSFLLIPILSVMLTAVCEDDRLLVTKEGMAFPLFMLPGLGFRRERLWSELSAVELSWSGASDYEKGDALSLYFRAGGSTRLKLSSMSKTDLEQLLLALEVWGEAASRPPRLMDFQNLLQNENKGLEHISYTQMWEEEMSRRFSATAFVPLEPGKELQSGRLKVVRQLAFGGLSAIYLAQRENKELVVLKEAVVPPTANQQAKEKATELFDREARFLARLKHPQIARVLDHFIEEGRNYLVLEYVQGQDLRQLVKQHGAQPEQKVLRWASQIARILEYLHGQDPPIIHRDLTPDNLVLKDDGTVILIDFGAANEFVGTATGTLVGKQAYIAPEQFRGKARTQSDIYALGGTIHFLLTGQEPEALAPSHPSELRPEVSSDLNELVARASSLEPQERPETAAELAVLIERIMEGSESLAQPKS